VTARTAEANRLHADLSILLPGYAARIPSLVSSSALDDASSLLDGSDEVRAGIARRRVARLRRLDEEVIEMTADITQALEVLSTSLTNIHGVGPITAALARSAIFVGSRPSTTSLPATAPRRSRSRPDVAIVTGSTVAGTAA